MAQYTVTAGCGHTTTLQLYGPTKDRDRRIAWMESPDGKCNPCYATRKRSEEAESFEAEVGAFLSTLLAQPRPTDEILAKLKAQAASGMGSPARREAFARYLQAIA